MRYVLDFGASNAGGLPAFAICKDLATLLDLIPPPLIPMGNGRFYFETTFPLAASPSTSDVVFLVTLTDPLGNVLDQDGVISTGGGSPPAARRYVIGFTRANAGGLPAFLVFQDLLALAPLPQPVFYEIGLGLFYFDLSWPLPSSPGTTSIDYLATCGGLNLSDVISSGPIIPTQPASDDPEATAGGPQSLFQLRQAIRERSDTENDPHISDAELGRWVNASRWALYDKLIAAGENYVSAKATIVGNGTDTYPLPDGTLYGNAPAFYKKQLVELAAPGPQKWVTLHRFNLGEKNRFRLPSAISYAGLVNLRHCFDGGSLLFSRDFNASESVRLWYSPKLSPLVQDSDIADDWSGWLDYVVVDCAIRAVVKQERDPQALMVDLGKIDARIEKMVANRDQGEPATVTEIDDGENFGPFGGAFGGMNP